MSHIDTGDVLLVVTAARDVANRRQAVKAAQLITSIVEYSEDAIIGASLQGLITSWNPAAEKMYGYSRKEIIGRPGSMLAPPHRTGEILANLTKISAGQAVERLETIRVRKDGTVFPVSLTVAPIHDGDGAIVGASAVHRDVTEHREAFEVAQRMAAIVEGSEDAILGRTLDGIITSWNPAAEKMYGYSSQEIIGKPIALLVPDDRSHEPEAITSKIRAGEAVKRLETVRIRKDGATCSVSLTVSPIRGEDGAIVGASVISRDITEQKAALEASRTMAAIVQFSGEAIIGTTLDGIITSWNPVAERIYGYASEEIIGRPATIITAEDRTNEARAVMEKIRAGQYVEHLETTCIRKDGTVFPVLLSLAPIHGADGAIVGLSAIAQDVTEQR